jgi:hypothetical protein
MAVLITAGAGYTGSHTAKLLAKVGLQPDGDRCGYQARAVVVSGRVRCGPATAFIGDLESRLANRVQLTSNGHKVYLNAVIDAFPAEVDYAQLVKMYGQEPANEARYSPAKFTGSEKIRILGNPDPLYISTSYVERTYILFALMLFVFPPALYFFQRSLARRISK